MYTGTFCYLNNRQGNPLVITVNEYVNLIGIGFSRPKYGDKFCKLTGRKVAILNALSNIKLLSTSENFEEILSIKKILELEAEAGATSISYEFMDLWNIVSKFLSEEISDEMFDLDSYKTAFANLFGEGELIFEEVEHNLRNLLSISKTVFSKKISKLDAYRIFKQIVRSNNLY